PELPFATSGKVERRALPWPPRDGGRLAAELSESVLWLAERFSEQLGPVTIGAESDFFELGGSSLAAAKLASALRDRYPAVAVADVYNHRTVRGLAARLAQLSGGSEDAPAPSPGSPARRAVAQLGGLAALLALSSPAIVLLLLIADRLAPGRIGPQVGWAWLAAGWLVFVSPPSRGLIVAVSRRVVLRDLRPGRYPRNGWLSCRVWFVERIADAYHYERFAGTPWAWRFARLSGHNVGRGAYLDTLPPVTSLVSVGAGATIEGDVDLRGWWIEGPELVVGEVVVGERARVGTRALLMPGARIGAGAEVEPGSVVTGEVPAGERWAGSPAARVGTAGELWPQEPPAPQPRQRFWKWMFGAGMAASTSLVLVSAAPPFALTMLLEPGRWDSVSAALRMLMFAPVLGALYVVCDALLVAVAVRSIGRLIAPGLQPAVGASGWTLWFTESLLGSSRSSLFALYATVYTRPWLRLAGIRVQRRAEVSTATGINRLSRFGAASFAADDVAFAHARARDGWLVVEPIEVGARSFLGNGAILPSGTTVGADSLVGLLTTAPRNGGDGTSWLGAPALELPRRPVTADPRLTTEPSRARVLARAATEAVRILLPATVSVALALGLFYALDGVARVGGVAALVAATPIALLAAGILATAFTVAVKWLLIGRYRRGDHPLWSFFVWRDEIINSLQEQLSGPMLMNAALGTPLMSVYLRAMGARVGPDAWIDTFTVTEFDMVEIGAGAVANRNSVIETHLFHDRVLQIGTGQLGDGATLGPYSTMLPDSIVGEGCSIGARSIVMRGERLPAHTRWHGAPVVAR
ncbi:MAG: Pls/PosA family non-ribosomal peptide synthetase, partial [Solirubrobacteraceae bacterium]